ncbi:type VI secretion system lipoprotein TssJ [uncultured Caballeronia sp.]|jgi:type VI secretion system protein VasD|uniref:type VI secretion system lipoprotein TssJ n=1 Tax=uncultured Caballeronia sp. TaxID=1827198 RepID=UPI001577037E
MSLYKLVTALIAWTFVFMLAACASSDPDPKTPKEPLRLDMSVKAASDVNPDDRGRAAPIVVRVYELRNAETFKSQDFISLQEKDKALLADDINARDEFLLRPGDSKVFRRKPDSTTHVIGVLAAYRDLPNAVWRTTYDLPEARDAAWYRRDSKLHLNIILGAKAIKVTESK